MPAPEKWSLIEESYLKQYFGKKNIKLMMYELDKSRYSISLKTNELKLTKEIINLEKAIISASGGRITIIGNRTIHRMI